LDRIVLTVLEKRQRVNSVEQFLTAYVPRLTSILSLDFVFKDQLDAGLNLQQSICTRRKGPCGADGVLVELKSQAQQQLQLVLSFSFSVICLVGGESGAVLVIPPVHNN